MRIGTTSRVAILALAVGAPELLGETPVGALRFRDRTAAAGLDIVTWSGSREKPHILESTGNGVLVLDYDGDGFQDLLFVAAFRLPRGEATAGERGALYRNRGDGTFLDVTDRAGLKLDGYGHGGAVGDVDGDGWPDLYITNFGANVLYRNRGDGTFMEFTATAGVGDPRWSIGATFFDADGDGDLDLYVANYIEAGWEEILAAQRTRAWRGKVMVMDGPRGLPESPNTYYANRGDGTYVEATSDAGLSEGGMGYSMAVVSFDYDLDADVDLYVANDSTPNRLYRNRGNATFEEVATWAGCAYNADGNAQGSMGIGLGDYDGDGWFDLVVTNFAHDYYGIYRNLGGDLFQDASFVAGLAVPSYVPLGWAPLLIDADHDRDLDLFLSNGHIYPQVDDDPDLGESYRQKNQLLENRGGRFIDVSADAGEVFRIRESSRGAVWIDFDNDGDLDIVVSNQDARPTLMENVSTPLGDWIQLAVPLGSLVWATTGDRTQLRQSVSGGSYASENDPRIHFGLGPSERVDRMKIQAGREVKMELLDLSAARIYVFPRFGH